MELRPRTKVSGSQSRPRATSEGRTQLETNHLFNPVDTRVNSPLSPTGIARGGKTPSCTLSPEGGPFRPSSPNPRSESAGGSGGSPDGNPPRRRGQNWESGEAGGGSVFNLDPEVAADASGKPFSQPDEGQTTEFTMVPSVESLTRGSATATPTSARREFAVFDASHSTLPTSGADFQTRYAATHTNQTNRKQSTPGPFQPARADIAQTKVRQTEIGVDTVVPSTHLQSAVTDWLQVRPALTSMAPHRTTHTGLQNLSTAMAEVVASSSPTSSNRSAFSVRPPRVHRDLPFRSAFSATEFLIGREVSTDKAKRQMITTTTCGNVVSSRSKSVSTAQRLVCRDTPSSTLSNTDDEVAYLTGTKEPNYIRPASLLPPLAHPPSARSRLHRSGRSSTSRVSKVSRLTSASQHSLIDVNELVRDVLRQTAEIEERRIQSERERLDAQAKSDRERLEVAAQLEERRLQAEKERLQAAAKAERQRLEAIAAIERERLQVEAMRAESAATAERDRAGIDQRRLEAAILTERERVAAERERAAAAAEEQRIRAAAEVATAAATAAAEKERFEAIITAERERAAIAAAAEQQRATAVTSSGANVDRERAAAALEAEQRFELERQRIAAERERAAEERKALEAATAAEIERLQAECKEEQARRLQAEQQLTAVSQATGTFSPSVLPLRPPILLLT